MNGWIKLHRKILDNELLKTDHKARNLFVILLLIADRNGQWSGGRYQLAALSGIKPETLYKKLKRLQNEHQVNIKTNNKYSTISICNWGVYQGKVEHQIEQQMTTERTTDEHSYKNKNENKKENNIVETQSVYDMYIKLFNKNPNTYKLTSKRKAKIQSRLRDAGKEMLEMAILNTSKSNFHRGDNDRGWQADLDFIIRSYEQVEKLATFNPKDSSEKININDSQEEWVAI
jgi:hypothetical protein